MVRCNSSSLSPKTKCMEESSQFSSTASLRPFQHCAVSRTTLLVSTRNAGPIAIRMSDFCPARMLQRSVLNDGGKCSGGRESGREAEYGEALRRALLCIIDEGKEREKSHSIGWPESRCDAEADSPRDQLLPVRGLEGEEDKEERPGVIHGGCGGGPQERRKRECSEGPTREADGGRGDACPAQKKPTTSQAAGPAPPCAPRRARRRRRCRPPPSLARRCPPPSRRIRSRE